MKPTQPLEQAHSSSLRGSMAAMNRAAQQAQRIAAQTQTALVVERNGVLEHLHVSGESQLGTLSAQTTPTKKEH